MRGSGSFRSLTTIASHCSICSISLSFLIRLSLELCINSVDKVMVVAPRSLSLLFSPLSLFSGFSIHIQAHFITRSKLCSKQRGRDNPSLPFSLLFALLVHSGGSLHRHYIPF